LLCYAGFLRYSELANLKRNNIYFCDNYVKLFLENSKTDNHTSLLKISGVIGSFFHR
jgi:hypothetical protein